MHYTTHPSKHFCLAQEVWDKPHHIYDVNEQNSTKQPKLAPEVTCYKQRVLKSEMQSIK